MKYSNVKLAGILYFFGTTQFILGLIIAEILYPGYNISKNYLSDLGLGPSAIIFNLTIFLLGLFIIIGTYFLHKALKFKILTIMLILIGIGCMLVGIFTENVQPIHNIAAVIIFVFSGLSAISTYKFIKIPLSLINIILGLIILSAFVLYSTNQYLGLGPGGMERMIVYPIIIWTILVSGYLIFQPLKS